MLKFNKITVRALGFLNVTKTMKYQMAIRHRNKYRITMESNPPLPNLYSFTPLVFKTSYTFGKLNFYIPLVVQFLGNGWIRTKKIISVYSATVHVLYNYFTILFHIKKISLFSFLPSFENMAINPYFIHSFNFKRSFVNTHIKESISTHGIVNNWLTNWRMMDLFTYFSMLWGPEWYALSVPCVSNSKIHYTAFRKQTIQPNNKQINQSQYQ